MPNSYDRAFSIELKMIFLRSVGICPCDIFILSFSLAHDPSANRIIIMLIGYSCKRIRVLL